MSLKMPNTAPLCGIFDVLAVHRDNAPDWWESARFQAFSWAIAVTRFDTESTLPPTCG